MYTSYGLIINELNNITFKKTKLRVVMSFKSFAKKVFFLQIISFWSFRSQIHYDVLIDLISSSLNLMSNLTSTSQRYFLIFIFCTIFVAQTGCPCCDAFAKVSEKIITSLPVYTMQVCLHLYLYQINGFMKLLYNPPPFFQKLNDLTGTMQKIKHGITFEILQKLVRVHIFKLMLL